MKSTIFIQLIVAMTYASCLQAIPNYYDPNNIINAGAYWHFKLDQEKIAIARQHPAMKQELIKRVAQDIATYKAHAQQMQDNKPDAHYSQAITILEQGYQQLLHDLHNASTETSQHVHKSSKKSCSVQQIRKQRSLLNTVLQQTPEEIFGPASVRKSMPGQTRPDLADFKRRAQVEERYDNLMQHINRYHSCITSKKELRFIKQVKMHLKHAYESVIVSQGLHI